jgi:hypothetical protein
MGIDSYFNTIDEQKKATDVSPSNFFSQFETPIGVVPSTEPSFVNKLEAYGGAAARLGMHTLNSAVKFANENLPGPEDPDIIKKGLASLTAKAEVLPKLSDIVPLEKQQFGEKFTEGIASVVPVLLAGPIGGATAVIAAYQDQYDFSKEKGLSGPSSFFHGLVSSAMTAAMIAGGGAGKTLPSTLGKAAVVGPGLAVAAPVAQKGLAALEGSFVPEGEDNPYERYASEIGLKEIFDPTNIGVATALTFGFGVPHYVKANREANIANTVYKAAVEDGMAVKEPEKFSVLEQQVGKAVAGRPQETIFKQLQAGENVNLTDKQYGVKETQPVENGKDVTVDSILNNMAVVVDAAPRTEPIENINKKVHKKGAKNAQISPVSVTETKPISTDVSPIEPQLQVNIESSPFTVENKVDYLGKRETTSMGPSDEQLVATRDGKDIGRIWLTKVDGGFEVRKVEVSKENQRQGVAEKLYQDAFNNYGQWKGSTAQSEEGKVFVDAMKIKHPDWFEPESVTPIDKTPIPEYTDAERGAIQKQPGIKIDHPVLAALKEVEQPTKSFTSIDNVQNSHILTKGEPDSSMPYRLHVDGTEGTKPTKENVKTITIDPDIWANETMLSKLKNDLPVLKEKYPKAEFSFVNSSGEGKPTEFLRTKSIGNKTLATVKKTFGATEDVQPRAERSNISTEEKVARLLLKDKEAVKLMAKNNPEMLLKLKNDAGQRVNKVEKSIKGSAPEEPTFKVQQDVWYKGFKDGDSVIHRDPTKVMKDLPGLTVDDLVVGKMDGTNFIPNETKIVSENEQSTLKALTDLITSKLDDERGSFSIRDKVASRDEIDRQKKVLTQLRQQYNYKKAYAESLGLDVKTHLLSEGMTEEQFNQFSKLVNADKGFTNPQMGHYLRKALDKTLTDGFSDADYKWLKTQLTGIESMKDMNPGQQRKVLDVMQQLHFAEKGSLYNPKSKVSKHLVQRDIENAIVEQNLTWQNGWGTRHVLDYFIASAETYMSKTPAGADLVYRIKKRVQNATLRAADGVTTYQMLAKDMPIEAKRLAIRVHLGEVTSTNPKVNALAKFIHEVLVPYGQELENLGVKLKNPITGKKEAFKFDPNKPYWPMEFDLNDLQNPGRTQDLAVAGIAKKYNVSPAIARQKLNTILQNARKGPNSYGHLEIERFADLPNFNNNPDEVLPSYLYHAALRLEYIKEFGQDNIGLMEHIDKIQTQGGINAANYASAITCRAFGTREFIDPTAQKVVNALTTAEVFSKMGFSAISNATQPVNTYAHTNLKVMTKGLIRLINPLTRAEAVEYGHRSAATFHTMIDAYSEYRRDPSSLINWLRSNVPKGERIFTEPTAATNFLKYTGFTQVEVFNRIYTAVVGREYIKMQVEQLAKTLPNTRANKLAQIRLKKLGLDPNSFLETVTLENGNQITKFREPTAQELYQGSNALVDLTQFRNWAISLPKFTGDPVGGVPIFRLVTQLQTFGFHQTRAIKELWRTEPERILPMLTAMAAAGLVAGSAKDLLKGRERKWETASDTTKNLIYFMGQAGGFGLFADTMQGVFRDKTGLIKAGAGPVLGDLSEYAYGIGKTITGSPEHLGNKMLKDVPIVGGTIYNLTKDK